MTHPLYYIDLIFSLILEQALHMFELLGSKFLRNENQTDPENGIRSQRMVPSLILLFPLVHTCRAWSPGT